MSWVLSCETGISKVLIFFRCGEGMNRAEIAGGYYV
jgi:hypothetical protein